MVVMPSSVPWTSRLHRVNTVLDLFLQLLTFYSSKGGRYYAILWSGTTNAINNLWDQIFNTPRRTSCIYLSQKFQILYFQTVRAGARIYSRAYFDFFCMCILSRNIIWSIGISPTQKLIYVPIQAHCAL